MNKLKMCLAMLIFGTIGVFVKYIPLSSSIIAMTRGYMGAAFLFLVMLVTGSKPDFLAIKKNILPLTISGAAIGVNWILLFEAYNYVSIAVATLCYYMQPVMLIILTPFVLKEKLSKAKVICVPVALFGMVLVSGIFTSAGNVSFKGIALGLGAAVFYTSVIIINRFLKDISAYDSTLVQLFAASVVITPYNLLTQEIGFSNIGISAWICVVLVGFLHTGFTYYLYFSSVKNLPSETVAIYSYIDPAFAVLLSVFLLREGMDKWGIIGAVLILGATLASEVLHGKRR